MKPCSPLHTGLLFLTLCLPALGQNTIVTYQGRVTSHGTNFSGQGQFKAALVNVTNNNHTATATANPPSGGFVTVVNVTFGGNGYLTAPSVTLAGGGGSGATATASVSGGIVTAITINNPGSGYSSAPTVLVAPPPPALVFTTRWSNDGTSNAGSEPATSVVSTVTDGLFTLRLGDATMLNMAALDAGAFEQSDLHVRLWFNNGTSGFSALSPSQPLTAAPYAAVAGSVRGTGSQPLKLTVGNETALRVSVGTNIQGQTGVNWVGGPAANVVSNGVIGAFIGGGGSASGPNVVANDYAAVLGGERNEARGYASTVSGYGNRALGFASTAFGEFATAEGGLSLAGGSATHAFGSGSLAWGFNSRSTGSVAVAMGEFCWASGDNSMALGYRARATHPGSFAWCDPASPVLSSSADGEFSVRASGGVRLDADVQLGTGHGDYQRLQLGGGNSSGYLYGSFPQYGDGVHLSYNYYARGGGAPGNVIVNPGGATSRLTAGYGFISLSVGAVNNAPYVERLLANEAGVTVRGTFNNLSDRNSKQDIKPIDPAKILEGVLQLPLSQWSYKEDAATRHIGPMAQDFHAAFNVGTDDKHIAPIDEGGVALAAIQGLNKIVREKDVKIRELEHRLEKLEEVVLRTGKQ